MSITLKEVLTELDQTQTDLLLRAMSIFYGFKGAAMLSMVTDTIEVQTGGQKNPQQGRVHKLHTGFNCQCFTSGLAYQNQVNKRLGEEGKEQDFVVGERRNGMHIEGTPFIFNRNTGKVYLYILPVKTGKIEYQLDGDTITPDKIIGLKESKGASQNGLERKVYPRDFKLESIVSITFNHQTQPVR